MLIVNGSYNVNAENKSQVKASHTGGSSLKDPNWKQKNLSGATMTSEDVYLGAESWISQKRLWVGEF